MDKTFKTIMTITLLACLAVITWVVSLEVNDLYQPHRPKSVRADTILVDGRMYQVFKYRGAAHFVPVK